MSRKDFRVGTFNLYNLALPNRNFHHSLKYSSQEYSHKKIWLNQQLERMRSDIVGFQEVIHVDAFKELLQENKSYQKYHQVIADNKENQPTIALISKFPVLKYQVITDFPPEASFNVQNVDIPFVKFSKPVLLVEVALTKKITTTIIVVHLKSKAPIFPRDVDRDNPVEKAKGQGRALILRTAEAIALRILLIELLKDTDHPVILMGDVNDGGLAFTSQIITGDSPRREDEFHKKKAKWDVLLYSVKDIQNRQSHSQIYYTYIHNGYYQSLDHILVSQEWVAENPHRLGRVKYVTVFNDHLIDDSLSHEKIPCWQSDHGQVVASFSLE